MHHATVKNLSADLAAKKYSSVELTRHFLNRIKTLNGRLNCFITLDEERQPGAGARCRRACAPPVARSR